MSKESCEGEPKSKAFSNLSREDQENMAAVLRESMTFGLADSHSVYDPEMGVTITFNREEIDMVFSL